MSREHPNSCNISWPRVPTAGSSCCSPPSYCKAGGTSSFAGATTSCDCRPRNTTASTRTGSPATSAPPSAAWAGRSVRIERVFVAQEDAFGKPGEPGDAGLIQHFAGWIIEVYRRLLDRAGTVRSAGVPEEFELAVELSSQAADLPLLRIRSFIDETVAAVDQLPAKLAAPENERLPIELRLTLTLEADNELMGAAVDELRRVLGQEPDGWRSRTNSRSGAP